MSMFDTKAYIFWQALTHHNKHRYTYTLCNSTLCYSQYGYMDGHSTLCMCVYYVYFTNFISQKLKCVHTHECSHSRSKHLRINIYYIYIHIPINRQRFFRLLLLLLGFGFCFGVHNTTEKAYATVEYQQQKLSCIWFGSVHLPYSSSTFIFNA